MLTSGLTSGMANGGGLIVFGGCFRLAGLCKQARRAQAHPAQPAARRPRPLLQRQLLGATQRALCPRAHRLDAFRSEAVQVALARRAAVLLAPGALPSRVGHPGAESHRVPSSVIECHRVPRHPECHVTPSATLDAMLAPSIADGRVWLAIRRRAQSPLHSPPLPLIHSPPLPLIHRREHSRSLYGSRSPRAPTTSQWAW